MNGDGDGHVESLPAPGRTNSTSTRTNTICHDVLDFFAKFNDSI